MSSPAEMVKKFGIDQLSVEERISLIDEIWKSIDSRDTPSLLPSRADIARYEQFIQQELDDWDDEEDLFVFPRGRH